MQVVGVKQKMMSSITLALGYKTTWLKAMMIFGVVLLTCAVVQCELVPFTPVANAVQRRAVCMDGSPAGYHYSVGFGDGANNWLILLNGGGWCPDVASCRANRLKDLGSTRLIKPASFNGILSSNQDINQDFYNWNKVFVVYCDQSSFLGDTAISDSPGSEIQFRGSMIFDSVVEDLMGKGLKNGDNVILGGSSAGGLATILHCDNFRERLPDVKRVKCLSDAGFFIRAENVANADYRERYFASTIMLHNISGFLPTACTKRLNPNLCLFPEYLVGDIKTPLFILNSAFDSYQVGYRLASPSSSGWQRWTNCTENFENLTNCPDVQQLIIVFGAAFFDAIRNMPSNPSTGLFIHDCFSHTIIYDDQIWSPNSTVKLENMTMAQAFSDWYFDRDSVTLITPSTSENSCNITAN